MCEKPIVMLDRTDDLDTVVGAIVIELIRSSRYTGSPFAFLSAFSALYHGDRASCTAERVAGIIAPNFADILYVGESEPQSASANIARELMAPPTRTRKTPV